MFHSRQNLIAHVLGSVLFGFLSFFPVPAHKTAATEGSHFANFERSRIYYQSFGKGREALVFIHGWTGNSDLWREEIEGLRPRARVIAIDLPGHGKSDKTEKSYTQALFARAVDAVLKDAGVDRAVLVGHSMGTPISRQFYRLYPQKTLGIVIVDGGLISFDKETWDRFIAPLRTAGYKEAGTRMLAGMLGPQVSPEVLERVKSSFLSTPQQVMISALEGMADESIWGSDKINVPVLAIMAKSPFWPANVEELYRNLAPNLDFQMWQGVGHFLMMEKPKEFDKAVWDFLDKNGLLKQ